MTNQYPVIECEVNGPQLLERVQEGLSTVHTFFLSNLLT